MCKPSFPVEFAHSWRLLRYLHKSFVADGERLPLSVSVSVASRNNASMGVLLSASMGSRGNSSGGLCPLMVIYAVFQHVRYCLKSCKVDDSI